MKKYDLDILFNDKDLLEELIYEDEEEEVIEDDTVIDDSDDTINENEEVLSTINKLTHIINENGQKLGSYCFVEEVMNIYGLSQEEVVDIAKNNNYKIMKVFPNEQVDGGLIIADKTCSASHIKEDYLKFYGVEADVKDLKESLLKEEDDDEISQSFKIPSKGIEIETSPIEYKDSDWSYVQFDGFYHFKEEDFETELEALDYFIWDNDVLYNSSQKYKDKLIVKTYYKDEFKSEYTYEQAKKIVDENKSLDESFANHIDKDIIDMVKTNRQLQRYEKKCSTLAGKLLVQAYNNDKVNDITLYLGCFKDENDNTTINNETEIRHVWLDIDNEIYSFNEPEKGNYKKEVIGKLEIDKNKPLLEQVTNFLNQYK